MLSYYVFFCNGFRKNVTVESWSFVYLIYKYVTDEAKYDDIIPKAAKEPPSKVTVR